MFKIGDRVILIKDGLLMGAKMDKGDTGIITEIIGYDSIFVQPDWGPYSNGSWVFTVDFLKVVDLTYEQISEHDLLEVINCG